MKTIDEKISYVVTEIRNILKDFQLATVERLDMLFENGQSRILVADEVGMGKTMIAKGIIALMAKHRYDEGDRRFKVIYVCSNQSIANQNISKLDVFETGHEDISGSRLSMQHLLVEKTNRLNEDKFIQLIPLTPQTSFNQRAGRGMAKERALMFCIMKRMDEFKDGTLRAKLEQMLRYGVKSSWNEFVDSYDDEIKRLEEAPGSEYPSNLHKQIIAEREVFESVRTYLSSRSPTQEHPLPDDRHYIAALRKLFAKISIGQLQPDLVIMDEFQNFQFLLNSNDEEIRALADCFFGNNTSDDSLARPTKVLLLSATPYKLFTTLEEDGDTNMRNHYSEFLDVMKFLFHQPDRFSQFLTVWNNYSSSLNEIRNNEAAILLLKKHTQQAEGEIYKAVARTERISVMDNSDYTDDTGKNHPLELRAADIQAYVKADELMKLVDRRFRVDYIKSCPFPLSFMNNYVEKKHLHAYFTQHKDKLHLAKSPLLWIDKKKINRYQPLPEANARFEFLKSQVFKKNSELLLWMPPTQPYYKPAGVFKNQQDFSKILIFSSWEMVPKMIGSLISYEEERLTIGKLINQDADKLDAQSHLYFKKTRYPAGRLKLYVLPVYTMLYPSRFLARVYQPAEYLSKGIRNIHEIEKSVREKIRKSLYPIKERFANFKGKADSRWYCIAPMLLDKNPEYIINWIDSFDQKPANDSVAESSSAVEGVKSFATALDTIWKIYITTAYSSDKQEVDSLGRVPADLEDVLTSIAIASPAVCMMRTLKDSTVATTIAHDFIRYFNSPENTAIVELSCSKNHESSDDSHWRDVLRYCKMGNLQAMIDEFVHLLREGKELQGEKLNDIRERFHECLTLHSAPYSIDSFRDFSSSIISPEAKKSGQRLRSHYAAGFSKGENSDDKTIARKDNLRNAFNSPFWPFVLASTSIGQEGLDFHLYCRKIMHWNLPSNPVDLEQREGRINRFKCHAIRANIARKYGEKIHGTKEDVWDELFETAMAERQPNQPELIPYWCFGRNQEVKIERLLPLYPLSKDTENYKRLIKYLYMYRLTLGQSRQEDLLEHVFNNFSDTTELKKLFINLSPFFHQTKP